MDNNSSEPTPSLNNTGRVNDTVLRRQLIDVLMTPNQAWRGLTSIPIELLWGIEALIKSESDKAVEAFAAELKGETERIYCEEGFIEGVTTETIDQALIERTKHE